jgi:hypothetical protein
LKDFNRSSTSDGAVVLCFVRGNIYPLCFVVGVGEESIDYRDGSGGPFMFGCFIGLCDVASQFCIVIVIHALTSFVYTFFFGQVIRLHFSLDIVLYIKNIFFDLLKN